MIIPQKNETLARIADTIARGGVIAFRTDTFYGLGADPFNVAAVQRIKQLKGREERKPVLIVISDCKQVSRFIHQPSATFTLLAEGLWPGPLTLVVPLRENAGIASIVTAGLPTIGLRLPAHPAMQALLRAVGRPLAAPSANASGAISPTRAEHVLKSLGGRISLIIDGGPSQRGLESTIVAATGGPLRLLRPGPVQVDAAATKGGKIEAPGQLASHYAPSKPLRLNASSGGPDEYLIGFGEVTGDANLSRSGDLVEAAARLFDLLHEADASAKPRIAVAPVPNEGLGAAIIDRLRRAAA